MITKELLERFLKNECTPTERTVVADYLKSHPEALDDLLPEKVFTDTEPIRLEADQSEKIYSSIEEHVLGERRSLIRWIKPLAVAASISMVFLIIWMMRKQDGPEKLVAEKTNAKEQNGPALIRRMNTSQAMLLVTLPDSSTVELAPQAMIEYHDLLAQHGRREVSLNGEAVFTVTKNKQLPFRVNSGDISTIVLGTSFQVTNWEADPTIRVRLFTGKVRIGSSDQATKVLSKEINLVPGNLMTYNKATKTALVSNFSNRYLVKRNPANSGSDKSVKQPDWYMFGGQPLNQVFDQLSVYYGKEINYYPSDVANRYFTGTFSPSDSLETILRELSVLHDLSLSKENEKFIFRKAKKTN